MPKIKTKGSNNLTEYNEILNQLRYLKDLMQQGYEYVARSQSGVLTVFKKKPYKEINFWFCGFYGIKYEKDIDKGLFYEVNFHDENPLNIKSVYESLKDRHSINEKDIAYDV